MKLYQDKGNYYDEMKCMKQKNTFQFEDRLSKNAQGLGKTMNETLLLRKFLQAKPQDNEMNNKFYDLYDTFIKNRNKREVVELKDYDKFNDFVNIKN